MRICLLTTVDPEPAPDVDWPCDPRPFYPAEWTVAVLEKANSVETVERLVSRGFDLFFNLCDGAADEDTAGVEVVLALERAGVPFTGATSDFFEPSRPRMKEVCRELGIPAPKGVVVGSLEEAERAARELRYPLIVKHHSSYASVALSRASRVVSPAGLRRQVRKILTRYGRALIEEFIEGDEYTVLVSEDPEHPDAPATYTPIQYRFPPGERFKHERLKWVEYAELGAHPVADPALASDLRELSARFFAGIGGAGFARCDLRVDADGTPFMLEINPNCGIYYPESDPGSADLCLLNDPAGHEGFTRRLVEAALRRHRRSTA